MGRKAAQILNHPQKGATIKTEPIRSLEDVARVREIAARRPMDAALFAIGVNTNLRASDILRLKVGQVRNIPPGGEIEIREKKTRKIRRITLNRNVVAAVQNLLASKEMDDDQPLFTGQRGAWCVPYVSQKVKGWCREANLRGNYGSHSLRKTWGYHQRVTFGQSLPLLMECFNHSTQRQTLDYLCIQDEEVRSVYMNEIG